MSAPPGPPADLKSRVSEELQQLRQKGLAKTQRGKFKHTSFRTPEEAQAYLNSIKKIKKKQDAPTPPTNLKSTDLNDWYSQQRQMELEERKRRKEAEQFLRGYRSTFDVDMKGKSPSSPKKMSKGDYFEDIVNEGVDDVFAEVEKLENGSDEPNVGGADDESQSEIESESADTGDDGAAEDSDEVCAESSDDAQAFEPKSNDAENAVQDLKEKEDKEEEESVKEEKDGNDVENEVEEKMDGNGAEGDEDVDEEDGNGAEGDEEVEKEVEEEDGNGAEGNEEVEEDDEKDAEEVEQIEEEKDGNEGEDESAVDENVVVQDAKAEEEPIADDDKNVDVPAVESKQSEPKDEDSPVEENNVANDDEDPMIEENPLAKTPVDTIASVEENPVAETPVDTSVEEGSEEEKKDDDVETTKSNDDGWRFLISSEPGAKFAPEPDRYHLYVAYACPWAHRTVIVRNLKGLQDVIGVTYVHPTWQFTKPGEDDHRGWVFGTPSGEPLSNTAGLGEFPSNWGDEDPIMGATSIRSIYEKVNDTTGKFILPVLWDKKLQTIVSNESSEIIRMLNFEFNALAKNAELNLYPEEIQKDIDEVNKWVYPSINNGVYRCGLASTQAAYDAAIDELTEAFDKINSILQKQRFLAGDKFTEADVRLFVTLFRYDEVYDVYFKCNTRSVATTPALLNYVREIYQMNGVTETCRMDMIKAHYFTSHVELNKYSIIPRGDNFLGLLKDPHNRGESL